MLKTWYFEHQNISKPYFCNQNAIYSNQTSQAPSDSRPECSRVGSEPQGHSNLTPASGAPVKYSPLFLTRINE